MRESDPVVCVADPATRTTRLIDVYRFVCVYVYENPDRCLVPGAPGRDLVVWQSRPYPSRGQILAVTDPVQRRLVVLDLTGRYGFGHAWESDAPVEQAFYALDELGEMAAWPEPHPSVEEDPLVSGRGRLLHADLQMARTDPTVVARRAVFTVDDWAPEGLEVKIAGLSGSRRVWLHFVFEAPARPGRSAVHETTVIAIARDL